jgi:hypothetical protein
MSIFDTEIKNPIEYDIIKMRLNVVPILKLVKGLDKDEVLKFLIVEMKEKKRMDHCQRLYRKYRYLLNREVDREFMAACNKNKVKIPGYILTSNGIKES